MRVAEQGLLKLTATVMPTESSMKEWRLSCWTIIRDAATARAAQHRSYLRVDRLAVHELSAARHKERIRPPFEARDHASEERVTE